VFVVAVALLAAVAVQARSSSTMRVASVPKFRWEQFLGKVVLVTGGSSGIGFATALSFARYGARVIICSRDSNPSWFNGTDAARRINSDLEVMSLGGYARWVKADVANQKDVDALIKNIKEHEGTIDFAVNNAGIAGLIGYIHDKRMEEIFNGDHDAIRVNVFGTARMLAAELKLWAEQKRGGAIVNTASVDGMHGAPRVSMYCTSKHAVVGLTKSVAAEVVTNDPPIRVNAIAPGFTDTSLVWQQCKYLDDKKSQSWEGDYINHDHPLWAKYHDYYASRTPVGKLCDPMDQARMVMYLCSLEAQYITGAIMVVDGGINNGDLKQ